MNNALRIISMALVLLSPALAFALPRFAARTGNECIQCHVNPSGGGVRNSYGRNVFERVSLPLDLGASTPALSLDLSEQDLTDLEATLASEQDGSTVSFSGDVTDWLALGAEFRGAYYWIRPDQGVPSGSPPNITSTFFLMEALLYMAATLHPNVQLVFQFSVYLGFEAWGLFRLLEEGADANLLIKIGRFMPAFGIREVQHQLFTREFIGLGNADRDTGIELTGYAGPLTAQVSLLNGSFTGVSTNTTGTERRAFELAAVGRLALRADLGWGRGQIGGSFYFSENNNQPSPLFTGMIPPEYLASTGQGANEYRAGVFLTANIGRFTYMTDLVYVRDEFYDPNIPVFEGYASYQELSYLVIQGIDVLVMLEFMDQNMGLTGNGTTRAGLALEFFPMEFTEMRAMVRRTWSESTPTGGSWDIVLIVHLFM